MNARTFMERFFYRLVRQEERNMKLSKADKAFVEKRERRAKYWPLSGAALLVTLVTYGAWLWLKVPHLINPGHVIERLNAGTLSESTMGVMVVMLPIVIAALLVFAFVVVLLWFISFRNESRLIRLVRELQEASERDHANG